MGDNRVLFAPREKTERIIFDVRKTEDKPLEDIFNIMRKNGRFDTGYHFFIHKDGSIEKDRHEHEVAGFQFKHCETAIAVKVTRPYTSAQKRAKEDLIKELKKKYPKIKIRYAKFKTNKILEEEELLLERKEEK